MPGRIATTGRVATSGRAATSGRVATSGRFWTPIDLPASNLSIWARPDMNVTLNAGNVSAWGDQSGNGNHLLQQAFATKQPLWVANSWQGHPGVRLDGVDDYMKTAPFALASPAFVFMVYKMVTLGVSAVHDTLWDGNSFASFFALEDTAPSTLITSNGGGATISYATAAANGAFDYLFAQVNGASSFGRVHGVQVMAGNAGVGNAGGFTLGALSDGTRTTAIEVLDLVVGNGALAPTWMLLLESYARDWYGL